MSRHRPKAATSNPRRRAVSRPRRPALNRSTRVARSGGRSGCDECSPGKIALPSPRIGRYARPTIPVSAPSHDRTDPSATRERREAASTKAIIDGVDTGTAAPGVKEPSDLLRPGFRSGLNGEARVGPGATATQRASESRVQTVRHTRVQHRQAGAEPAGRPRGAARRIPRPAVPEPASETLCRRASQKAAKINGISTATSSRRPGATTTAS